MTQGISDKGVQKAQKTEEIFDRVFHERKDQLPPREIAQMITGTIQEEVGYHITSDMVIDRVKAELEKEKAPAIVRMTLRVLRNKGPFYQEGKYWSSQKVGLQMPDPVIKTLKRDGYVELKLRDRASRIEARLTRKGEKVLENVEE